jgi:hypothetical protein
MAMMHPAPSTHVIRCVVCPNLINLIIAAIMYRSPNMAIIAVLLAVLLAVWPNGRITGRMAVGSNGQ